MSWRDLTGNTFLGMWKLHQTEPVEAFPTPFDGLNGSCRDAGGGIGIARGWNVTLGGAPGTGKSVIALNLACAAMQAGQRVAFLSLEMSAEQCATRFYSIASGIPLRQLERGAAFDPGTLGERLQSLIMSAGPRAGVDLCADPIYRIEDVLDRLHTVTDPELTDIPAQIVIVDYLQLVGVGDEESITRATSEIASQMRVLAHQHEVTVIGLSQYNRSTSANRYDSPTAQSLYGGMSLEASSDLVLLLDHARYDRQGDEGRTYLRVGKNRHGPTPDIPIAIDYRTLRAREAMPHEEKEWPERPKRTR